MLLYDGKKDTIMPRSALPFTILSPLEWLTLIFWNNIMAPDPNPSFPALSHLYIVGKLLHLVASLIIRASKNLFFELANFRSSILLEVWPL